MWKVKNHIFYFGLMFHYILTQWFKFLSIFAPCKSRLDLEMETSLGRYFFKNNKKSANAVQKLQSASYSLFILLLKNSGCKSKNTFERFLQNFLISTKNFYDGFTWTLKKSNMKSESFRILALTVFMIARLWGQAFAIFVMNYWVSCDCICHIIFHFLLPGGTWTTDDPRWNIWRSFWTVFTQQSPISAFPGNCGEKVRQQWVPHWRISLGFFPKEGAKTKRYLHKTCFGLEIKQNLRVVNKILEFF